MKTILLIEDDIHILENLTEFFEIEGYTILAADNGKRGIELAQKFKPDLIVCDVLMHEMNGYEVLSKILESPETYSIPFIFSTSLSENVDRLGTLKLGADDYIVKPYEPKSLLKIIKIWLISGSRRQVKN